MLLIYAHTTFGCFSLSFAFFRMAVANMPLKKWNNSYPVMVWPEIQSKFWKITKQNIISLKFIRWFGLETFHTQRIFSNQTHINQYSRCSFDDYYDTPVLYEKDLTILFYIQKHLIYYIKQITVIFLHYMDYINMFFLHYIDNITLIILYHMKKIAVIFFYYIEIITLYLLSEYISLRSSTVLQRSLWSSSSI